jgi:hypothetical protein
MRNPTKEFAVCAVVAILFALHANGQTVNASLGGTVADSSGALLPGATVTVTGIETGVVTKAVTNEAGTYQFPSLQAGGYKVSAELPGFQEFIYQQVTLNVGAQVRLNFTLAVSGVATTVDVAVEASPLLATTATVGGVIQGQQILDLPLIDQSATSLALTQPQFAGGIGGGVSVAGGTTMSLLTTVNGISVSNTRLDRAGGLQSFQLTQSVDLVEEVKVVSSPADAESGRALGQVQMIVRSGTNQLHGSVVDGLRNTALNANTFWNNYQGLPRQDLKRNQYAARLGGPIRKNKTFFFGLYAGNRQVTSASSTRTVLTGPARSGNFRFFPGAINANANATSNPTVDMAGNPVQPASATGLLQTISVLGRDPNRPNPDPTALVQKYIAMTPLPNNFTVGDGLNTAGYTWQIPSFSNSDQYTGKIDHNFNEKHHMNIVLTRQHDSYTATAPNYPDVGAVGVSQLHSWFGSLNFTSTFGTKLNEFKAGFQHPDLDQVSGTRAYPKVYPSSNGTLFTPGFLSFTSPIPGNIDSELIDPVYTVGDTFSWTHGRHAFKAGFQADSMSSNSFNINNNYVPSVTFGAGSTAVQGISNIPGLVAQNQTLATNLLLDLTGSIASITQGFGVADGKNPVWIPYPNRRAWHQRDAGAFFKDDFKATANLTLNLGLRWDYVGVPWDSWGRTPAPVGGFGGLFGVSGTNFNVLWSPGASGGSLTEMQTVGPHSAHPGQQLYKDYYKGFAPAVGLSWSIPYFGKDKTVLRAGYTWTRPMSQSFLAIDGSVPSFGTSATLSAVTATFLNSVNLPLSPSFNNPLQVWPINDKTQNISTYDPNFKPPLVQSFNASLEREIASGWTVAVRYVGNKTTHLPGGYDLNWPNVFENGIAEATTITAQGNNAPLFDKLLMGVNVPGVGVVDGRTITGSQALRAYNGTFGFLASNSAASLASYLNTTQALQPAATATRGGVLTNAGLPANFVVVNPQYNRVSFTCACLNTFYNSGDFEVQKRFSKGLALQSSFVWAKNMQLNGTSRDARNLNLDRTQGGTKFSYKASGTYELPVGHGHKFLDASTGIKGIASKILGGWQTGGILTLTSGSYLSLTCGGNPINPTAGTNTCTNLMALPKDPGHIIKDSTGVVYYDSNVLTQVKDPFCDTLTTQQALQSRCQFQAMAYNGQLLFANSPQGTVGTMSSVTNWTGPGLFDLDMNILKRFAVREGITAELRVDGIAITNTPHFTNPNLNINGQTFGRISAPSAGGANSFTTPAPFYGNRVFVINARVSF